VKKGGEEADVRLEGVFLELEEVRMVVEEGGDDAASSSFVGSGPRLGKLRVTSEKVEFCADSEKVAMREPRFRWETGFSEISMHALSSDAGFSMSPCVYCQLVGDDEEAIQEVKFVPKDASTVQAIFDALSRGVALHPDRSGENEEPGFAFDCDTTSKAVMMDAEMLAKLDLNNSSENGEEKQVELSEEEIAHKLAHWESLFVVPGQFEDALKVPSEMSFPEEPPPAPPSSPC